MGYDKPRPMGVAIAIDPFHLISISISQSRPKSCNQFCLQKEMARQKGGDVFFLFENKIMAGY